MRLVSQSVYFNFAPAPPNEKGDGLVWGEENDEKGDGDGALLLLLLPKVDEVVPKGEDSLLLPKVAAVDVSSGPPKAEMLLLPNADAFVLVVDGDPAAAARPPNPVLMVVILLLLLLLLLPPNTPPPNAEGLLPNADAFVAVVDDCGPAAARPPNAVLPVVILLLLLLPNTLSPPKAEGLPNTGAFVVVMDD